MSWVATAVAAGSVGSALIGANASRSAARSAADAAAANRPAPVDINQAMRDYINSITDVGLQNQIMGAEGQFRPGYMALNAADIQAGLIGTGGSRGALDFIGMSADRMAELNQRLGTQNTEYQLAQLNAYGPQATAAYMAANPDFARAVSQMQSLGGRQVSGYLNEMGSLAMQPASAAQISQMAGTGFTPVTAQQLQAAGTMSPERVAAERVAAERIASGQVQAGEVGAGALGQSLYQQALANQQLSPLSQALQAQGLGMATAPGQITPEEARAATQGARERFASTGRLEDISAITGEALARAGASREARMQDLAASQAINAQLLGAQQAGQGLATDVLRADIARQQANVATGLQAGTFNVESALRAAQANQQTGLQAGLANQDALLRAALANQQAGMQAQQFNITNLQGIQQANQAANLQAALANQQAGQRGFEFGATQNLQTQLANRDFAAQQAQQRFANLGAVLGAEQTMLGADRAYAGTMAGALAGITPAAISQAGIGQNAAAIPLGFTGYEAGVGLGSNVGPRMFNPDVGVNLALANQANQAGYGAAVAGGAATAAGARAGATANVAGSFAQTLPYLLGNMNFGGSTASAGVPASLSRTGTPYQAPGSGFSYGRPGG